MAVSGIVIREPVWKSKGGSFKAALGGIDFALVRVLETLARKHVVALQQKWPIGPERNRPHSITLFRVQRKRRLVNVTNSAPYAHFINSPRTIGSADAALRQMIDDISKDFAAHLKGKKYRAY